MATGRVPTTANSPLTAKGDLFGYSTTQARVPVGSDGETLVADSSTSTGLRWQGNYAAGKNVIINGDFNIWQRGTSQSVTEIAPRYGSADRWAFARNGTDGTGTNTVTRETHTVGQTDVPNNPTFFCRWTATTLATSQTRVDFNQYVENVNTFASQTVTLSFYVKSSGTFSISTFFEQNFGSGGSTAVTTTAGTGNTSTNWTRFTTTVTLPSISGKTVGSSNYLRVLIRFNNPTAGATFDVSNVQLEAGNVPTAFQTATGTLAGELAACQRYYQRINPGSSLYGRMTVVGVASSTTNATIFIPALTPMRTTPTSVDYGTPIAVYDGITVTAITALPLNSASTSTNIYVDATVASGLTQFRPYSIIANGSTAAYIGWSAEL